MPDNALTRMTEEEHFQKLRKEFTERLRGCSNRSGLAVLHVIDDCLGDLVAVGRSAVPNAGNSYEAPVIMTVLACCTTLGEAVREEIHR